MGRPLQGWSRQGNPNNVPHVPLALAPGWSAGLRPQQGCVRVPRGPGQPRRHGRPQIRGPGPHRGQVRAGQPSFIITDMMKKRTGGIQHRQGSLHVEVNIYDSFLTTFFSLSY